MPKTTVPMLLMLWAGLCAIFSAPSPADAMTLAEVKQWRHRYLSYALHGIKLTQTRAYVAR